MKTIMKNFLSTTFLLLGTAGLTSAATVFTIEIGTPTAMSNDHVGLGNASGITSTNTYYNTVSGPALPAGVTFDLGITSTGYPGSTGPRTQGGGVGVQGGQAASGIDNNFNGTGGTATTAVETITFTVTNVTPGYTIEITGFKSNFSADAGANTEYFNINGGAATPFPTAQSSITLTPATSFTIGALDLDGTGSDSRFVVQQLTFNAVPEPSTALLSALAGLTLLRRRR